MTEQEQHTEDNGPDPGRLADGHDNLGWDRAKHGTFAEHATPDDTVHTVSGDEYLDAG